ncbi:MAG: hypothetical protein Q8L66_14720 [Caulobacter sp.]|nr:hypothetical protein [Caulobacter sp.]
MTDEKLKTLKDDIAFMRALAQEGGAAPLLGGAILLAAGLIFAAASLTHWAVLVGLLRLPPLAFPAIWLGAVVIFLIALWIIKTREQGRPGASSPGNRASSVAWASVGWGVFAIGMSLAIIAIRSGSALPMLVFPSLILGLYGMGWSVAAAMSHKRWIWMTAIGSYASALLVAWFAAEPVLYLLYAAALILLGALPGFVLMRQEPSDTI